MASPYAALPSITALLQDPLLRGVPHELAVQAAREVVGEARRALSTGQPLPEDLSAVVAARVKALRRRRLRRVINATGVVLHTNLGRAPLAPEAAQAVAEVARGYSNVEMDLPSGERGGRLEGIAEALSRLCGAEDALVVNNNAAAVLLVLTALGRDRDVVVSRGELVEIGGSFRIPEVISAGGARLVEVGSTNRTRASDYAAAIGPETAMLLRVHPSNFRMLGFVERPPREDLARLAQERGVLLVEDLGSGLLGGPPVAGAGLEEERVDVALKAGVDLACFSGDKLLGGPQAGILAGRAELVDRLRRHPLYRALRCDKLVLAALEATLLLYREGREDEIPVRRMLSLPVEALEGRARVLASRIPGARVEEDETFSGGGALPAFALPARVVVLPVPDPLALARQLRLGDRPVVARVARDALILDPRTVLPGEEEGLVAAVLEALGSAKEPR